MFRLFRYNMPMRRLFIIRKDLRLRPGKLAAMVAHCSEAYWTNLMKSGNVQDGEFETLPAVETYGDERIGPAFYRDPELLKLSDAAFNSGEKTFTVRKENPRKTVSVTFEIPNDVWSDYVNGIFTKTVCEARNLNRLKLASEIARGLGLSEGTDFGYINDCCKTDLTPENEDGTTTVGIWFRPLPDGVIHQISRKYPLYRD